MGLARFRASRPEELTGIDIEIVELLSRVRGALGWDVTPEGEVHVEYDATRISESTLTNVLRGLGFRPAPVPVRAHYTYPVRRNGRLRR